MKLKKKRTMKHNNNKSNELVTPPEHSVELKIVDACSHTVSQYGPHTRKKALASVHP